MSRRKYCEMDLIGFLRKSLMELEFSLLTILKRVLTFTVGTYLFQTFFQFPIRIQFGLDLIETGKEFSRLHLLLIVR
jgi:hypothetical protein